MMYKLLPVVTAVAAERFLAAPAAFAGGQGEGYDIANSKVKSKAHGLADGNKLIYLLNGGTAQHPLADGTEYVVASSATDDFKLTGVTLTAADNAAYTAQTEAATWNGCVAVADNSAVGTCVNINAGNATGGTNTNAVTAVDSTDTKFLAANSNLTADSLVMYNCKVVGGADKCLAGMTNRSIWTVAAAAGTADFLLKAATGTGNLQLAAAQTDKENGADCGTTATDCHHFTPVGTAWKSITTAAPSAAASNFNVMVATVASGFLYLLM